MTMGPDFDQSGARRKEPRPGENDVRTDILVFEPRVPVEVKPTGKGGIPLEEFDNATGFPIQFGTVEGSGGLPPDESIPASGPTIVSRFAEEPEYPTGGGYFDFDTQGAPVVEEEWPGGGGFVSTPTLDTTKSGGSGGPEVPESLVDLPASGMGGGEVSEPSSPTPPSPPAPPSGGGEGDSFWSNWVDNSVVMSTVENVTNAVTTENSYYTVNNQTDMLQHIQNNIDNRTYTYGVGEDALAGVAGDLTDAVVAIGGVTAGVTALTSALPGMLGAALLGVVGGLASGWGKGVATEPTETVVNVQLPEQPVDDHYIGYGGGNAAGKNCAQMLQELLAAGGDATSLPPACKLELGIT